VQLVISKERFFVPTGEDQLKVEDQIYVFGRASDLDPRAGTDAKNRGGGSGRRRRSPARKGAGMIPKKVGP